MFVQRRTKGGIFAAAVVAAAALVASALPAHAETGVTSSTIKLGVTIPLTGAAAPGYNKIPAAMNAYFSYVNANGGVNGRQIKLVVKDDAYSPAQTLSVTNDLILKDKVFALVGTLGTANNEATTRLVNSQGVPRLFVNTGFSGFADMKKYPTTFPLFPSYATEAKVMGKYLADNFAGHKVALIYQDDDFGMDALKGFGTAGTNFVAKIPYAALSQADPSVVGKWITSIVAAGADTVVMFGVTSATGALAGGLYKANLIGKVQLILGSVGSDGTTLKGLLGPLAPALAGSIAASFLPSPADATDEYITQFKAINAQYNAGATFDNNVLVGMNTAMLTVQALRAAGTSPTRASLIKAIETKGSTWASAAFSPILYSPTSHVGYTGYWFGKLGLDGNAVSVDGPGKYTLYTTDSGSAPVVKASATRPAMPAKGLPKN
jgi:ABC-type branched-subunit amino acid transport system substrate-binding protein